MKFNRQALSDFRTLRKMSKTELAKKIGVSVQSVSKWERGASIPTEANLAEICRVLKAPISRIGGIPVSICASNNTAGRDNNFFTSDECPNTILNELADEVMALDFSDEDLISGKVKANDIKVMVYNLIRSKRKQ